MKERIKVHMDRERALLQRLAFFNPMFAAVFGWRGRGGVMAVTAILFSGAIVWIEPFDGSWQTKNDRTALMKFLLVLPLSAFLAANWLVEFVLKSMQLFVWAVSRRLWVAARTFVAIGLFFVFSLVAFYFHNRVPDGDLYAPVFLFFAVVMLFASVVLAWEDSVSKSLSNRD